jgi:LmbE family N-acetylglucosaminyl deacetylase
MRKAHPIALAVVAAAAALLPQPAADAQLRLVPVARQRGEVALALALRKLASTGTLMMTTAHPDDENNGLLAEAGHGLGWRTVLVSATRGDGGQNEIGPELFDALAVLRTEELRAAHAFDGAEQYFTRAVDFGYSFSIDETFQKWGKEEILSDFVRLIRTIRPDVIVGFLWDGTGGGQHHQASSRLTAEAFRAAADPSRFPEQIAEGLRPWQAKKFYYTAGFFFGRAEPAAPGVKVLSVDSGTYDPLLGRTYAEIGAEARSMHKCQGMSQLLPLPGASRALRYVLHDTVLPGQRDVEERSVTDGIDATLPALARFAGSQPPAALTSALASLAATVEAAGRALASGGPAAAARPLAEGLAAARSLRAGLGSLGLSDEARDEIDVRLARKVKEFEQALLLAHGLRIEATADDGLVIPGQEVKVSVTAAAMAGEPVSVSGARVAGLEAPAAACQPGTTGGGRAWRCEIAGRIPAGAPLTTPYFRRLPDAARYAFDPDAPFGLPFRPTPYRVTVDLGLSGVDVSYETDVEYRYEDLFAGEKRMELTVVPAMAVRLTPEIVIVPAGEIATRPTVSRGGQGRPVAARLGRGRELRVTVINQTKGAASAEVSLDVPAGWTVTPAVAPVTFAREDEAATVRFDVVPAAQAAGTYTVKARVRAGTAAYDRGYEVVEYPHTSRRHVVKPAEATVKVLDVRLAPDLDVGYVMGVGDMVPAAIEQLGARLHLLTADDLAWGDLDRYDVIVTGVRAYERRADLRANNHRLLAYAERGGTVLVQYNKFEFNEAQYGPWPAKVSSNRVTDEQAPVRVLVPDHPAFTTPNLVTAETWQGWVQERGLYFLGERDPRYVDLVETEDSFPYNAGPKRGALVEARTGKGRWIYIGLNLWRQLPAGTEGAYTLLANLLSLGKPTEARAARR